MAWFTGLRRVQMAAGASSILESYIKAMNVPPNETVRAALNTFFNTLVSQQLWNDIAIGYLMNLHTEQASTLNIKAPGSFSLATILNPPTWVSGVGGAGGFTASASSPLTTRWDNFTHNNGIITTTSAGATIRSRTNSISTSFDFGDTSRIHGRLRTTGDILQGRVMSSSTASSGASTSTDGSGIFTWTRIDASNFKVRREKADLVTFTNSNTSLNTGAVCVCGVAGASTSVRRISSFFIHASLSDTKADALYDAIAAFDTAIGAT